MNKKILIRLGIVAVIFIVVLLLLPRKEKGTHGNKFEVQTTYVNKVKKPVVSQIFLLLDASGSMKGYMDFSGLDNAKKNFANNVCYPLGSLVNDTNHPASLKVKYGGKGSFENVDINGFNALLTDGKTFNDATTKLADMISDALKQVSDTSIAMLVSDMVLSYGQKELVSKNDLAYNKNHLPDLGNEVLLSLKAVPGVDVLLLQYSSSYNGFYYYNCQENLIKDPKTNKIIKGESQYKGQLMNNRPYYIMVFGNRNMLSGLIDADVFAPWDNLYASFGLDNSDMTTGKLNMEFAPSSSWIWDNSSEDYESENMGTIWTTAELGSTQETFTVEFNKFDIPAFLNQKYEIGDYHLSKVVDKIKETTDPSNPKLLRFEVTLKPFNQLPEEGDLEFNLISQNSWVKGSSIDDDSNIDITTIEGKTWGLNAIVENIDKARFGNSGRPIDEVATVHFKVSKK